jgi:uncharacterized protein YecT (DUF1311 family)
MRFTIFLFCVWPMIGYAQVTANCKGNTVEISNCLDDELAKTEVVLNGLYGRVMRELSKPDQSLMTYSNIKKKVIDAQRAWVSFREKDCEAVYELNSSGSIRNIRYISCMRKHAEDRIRELKEYVNE